MGNEKEFQSTITLVKKLPAISMAVVFYNNDSETINKIVNNLVNVTKKFDNTNIFLINNSPNNQKLTNQLESLENNNNCIRAIISKENKGFGGGHNLVLPYFSSKYHFVINPDIIIPDDNVIENIVKYLNCHSEYGLLTPLIKYPNGDVQHLLKKESTVLDMGLRFLGLPLFKKRQENFVSLPDGYNYIHEAENVPGSFMVFRTDIFKEINAFDERYFLYMEDSDITKAVNQISKSVFFPKVAVYHEWQRDNKKSIKGILTMLRSMNTYFNKWGWKLW